MDTNNMLYAFVARGAKPGGINSSISTFDTETVISYEAGWKGSNEDGTLRTSISMFYNDYENFQSNTIDISTGRSDVYNIASATIQGLEASLEAQLSGWLLDLSASYVDSELSPTQPIVNTRILPADADDLPQCGAVGVADDLCFDYTPFLADVEGGPNLLAPKSSFTAGAEYPINLANGALLTPRINYAWVGDQWTNFLYDPTTDLLESRGLLSAMITYEKDNWMVRAWGKNLADEVYISGQSGVREFYGSPRTLGLTVNYNF